MRVKLFTLEERQQRSAKRDTAHFILTRANPPADLIAKAHEVLAARDAEEVERRAARTANGTSTRRRAKGETA